MCQKNVPKKRTQKIYQQNVPKKCSKKWHYEMSHFLMHILFVHFFNTFLDIGFVPEKLELATDTRKTCSPKTFQLPLLLAALICTCMACGQVQVSTATKQTERILVNMYCHQKRTRQHHRSKRQPYLRTGERRSLFGPAKTVVERYDVRVDERAQA
jgi:hypothetical protein